jgi:hypothetical protein
MAESIYNIFLFFDNDFCSTVGHTAHEHSGSDAEGCEYLRARLTEDLRVASKLELAKPFTRSEYHARCRIGEGHRLYDELFSMLNAGPAPLFVATPVKDGDVFFNYSSEHGILDMNDISTKLGAKGVMVDWLTLLVSMWVSIGGVGGTAHVATQISAEVQETEHMTISVNSNAKASQKINPSCIARKDGTRHGRKNGSKVAYTLGKAKNGWLGAALRRGYG